MLFPQNGICCAWGFNMKRMFTLAMADINNWLALVWLLRLYIAVSTLFYKGWRLTA